MSTVLYKQRIFCKVDNHWEYKWTEDETLIDKCPMDTSHEINPNSISIIETKEENSVVIKQEEIPSGQQKTNGHYKLETKAFDCSGNTTTEYKFSYPYPISMVDGYITSNSLMKGDIINIYLHMGKVIGVIGTDYKVNDTVLTVNSTVIDNLDVGFYVSLDGSEYSHVIAIDKINSTITIENGLSTSFSAGTPVQISINYASTELGEPEKHSIGTGTIGSSYIPENSQVTITYENKTGDVKRPVFFLEYLY